MNRAVWAGVIFMAVFAVCAQAQQTPKAGPRSQGAKQPSATGREEAEQAKMHAAGEAFFRHDYVGALRLFNEILEKSPDNIVALNMSGNCSLQLHDYPSAIQRFKLALALQPGEWHNVAGLLEAYSMGGMKQERDRELEYVKQLKREGKLPQNFSFVTDVFDMGLRRLQVIEFYPELAGRDHYRYWFNVYNGVGQQTYRVTLESRDHDQQLWAKQHPREAAAGERVFTLDGYTPNSHTRYRYYDGEPAYKDVVLDVQSVLQGKLTGVGAPGGPQENDKKPDSKGTTPFSQE